jgi:hypothetical protein
MERLVDAFNTKYFALHWAGDIDRYLAEKKEADIADARITTSVASVLSIHQNKGAYIIDSANEFRNSILTENRRRLAARSITKTLPTLERFEDLPAYLAALEEGTRYTVSAADDTLFLLGVVVQIYKPQIAVDFMTNYANLFKYIRANLSWVKVWDELHLLMGGTFHTVKVIDSKIYIPFEGTLPYDKAVSDFPLIPADFGTTSLDDAPGWSGFIDKVLFDLENQMEGRRMTMRDYCIGVER